MYCRYLEDEEVNQFVQPGFYRIEVVSQHSNYAKPLPHFDAWAKSISQLAISSPRCNAWGWNFKLITTAGAVTNCFSLGEKYKPILENLPLQRCHLLMLVVQNRVITSILKYAVLVGLQI